MSKTLFATDYQEILDQLDRIDPVGYGRSRNFIDGKVTRISPYISRGVISTKRVLDHLLNRGFQPSEMEKYIQELAWRDYWQQVWIEKGDAINQDLKNEQSPVSNWEVPLALLQASTGIEAIDEGIAILQSTGYMHNHLRMYTAALACNLARSHWKLPAQWMYFHLLDADWASNALSWQWVAGANANKKYVANQENINKYCYTQQRNTFLDVAYDELMLQIPSELKATTIPSLTTPLPQSDRLVLNPDLPTYLYNWYNLDPVWGEDVSANRILLLEPSLFEQYPISEQSIQFMLGLAKNIPDIQLFTGSFAELIEKYPLNNIHFKEHPLNTHYRGTEHPRDWMFNLKGYFPSFFGFWNKAKKELKW